MKKLPAFALGGAGLRRNTSMARRHTRVILARLWQLVTLLQGTKFGSTVSHLRQGLEVSRATLYRDLETLEQAGVSLETRTVNGETRYWLRGHDIPAVAPSPLQLAALCLARESMGTFQGTEAVRQLDLLLSRWLKLPKQSLAWSRRSRARGPEGIVSTIDSALTRGRRVALEYQGTEDPAPVRREVDPIALRAEGEQLYLFAFDTARADYRTFKLARTAGAQMLDAKAGDHSQVDVGARFARSVKVWSGEPATRVVVWISPKKARFIGEYPLVAHQEVDPQEDGSAMVRAEVNGTTEALRWVLSWGGHAEAIAPQELRQAATAELTGAAARYAERRPARPPKKVSPELVRRRSGKVGT
jgi:predicted DNA-binding transcriptional regulator YafY